MCSCSAVVCWASHHEAARRNQRRQAAAAAAVGAASVLARTACLLTFSRVPRVRYHHDRKTIQMACPERMPGTESSGLPYVSFLICLCPCGLCPCGLCCDHSDQNTSFPDKLPAASCKSKYLAVRVAVSVNKYGLWTVLRMAHPARSRVIDVTYGRCLSSCVLRHQCH